MASLSSTNPPSSRRRWLPIVIGAAGTALILAVVFTSGHLASRPAGKVNPGYAGQLRAVATRVSRAETMMAGSVTYVEGTVANLGPRTVTQVNATLRFTDMYGRMVQRSKVTLVDANTGPLAPGKQRSFRLGFDHVSAEWNQAPPAVKITRVYTR